MYKETDAHNKCNYSVLDWIAGLLLIVGGLNWGLVGLLNFDLVALLFGHMTTLSKIVYILVGLSAIYWLVKCCLSYKKNQCA
jgi:uncharacterized membrane protein YuzA (DUF378 family)